MPVAAETTAWTPYPYARDSAAAHSRRSRSSKIPDSAVCFSRAAASIDVSRRMLPCLRHHGELASQMVGGA